MVAVFVLALGVFTGTAFAAPQILESADTAKSCNDPVVENPFLAYGDTADYILAPGASFEDPNPAGWQFSGGARVEAGSDPYVLANVTDRGSLALKEGGSAISPAMCVDLNYPHFRFTAEAERNTAKSLLRVEIIYPKAPDAAFIEVGTYDGNDGQYGAKKWHITDELALKPELGGLDPGRRFVALRFTAQYGAWSLNDVYVDPKRH